MIYISAVAMINALGHHIDDIAANLQTGHAPGMQRCSGWLQQGAAAVFGVVDASLPAVPPALAAHDSRNNRLLLATLAQIHQPVQAAIQRVGRSRVAVVLGTSTSGLDEADRFVSARLRGEAMPHYHYYQQELGDPARFLSALLGLHGPAFTLSTACSSSARAIISGVRLLQANLADVALVGGADTLSRMPINGFHSLESLSMERCQPFARDRCGITIGEGAGLFLLTAEEALHRQLAGCDGSSPGKPHHAQQHDHTPSPAVVILGLGESSDAWHISAPHPQGEGAARAMRQALENAQMSASQLGYVNLHGTATPLNDKIEAGVMHQLFADNVPCSSTKHLTGHTLGAAGITEAALCALILQRHLPLPAQDFSRSPCDDQLPTCGLLHSPQPLQKPVIMSNSFAFGGNNVSLLLGRQP